MNIIQAGNNYRIVGGSDRVLIETSKLLEKHDINVIPFAGKHPDNYHSEYSKYFPNVIDTKAKNPADLIEFLYSREAKSKLKNLLSDVKIDLAHLHIYNGGLTPSILNVFKDFNIPVIQSLHEYRLACPVYTFVSNGEICESCQGKHFWKATTKKCNKNSFSLSMVSSIEAYFSKYLGAKDKINHFIAVSDFMKKKMVQYGVSQNKITTIHNFVNVNAFSNSTCKGEYFLYFGRIEKLKGIMTLIKSVESSPDIKIIIAGEGSDKNYFTDYVKRNKIKNITFRPFASGKELENLIHNCIATVIPSEWYENCPMTVLESLAHGKPVIGADIGGIPELIEHEKDGLLFQPGNIEELNNCLQYLSKNTNMANIFGQFGRTKINRDFNPEIHFKKLEEVYKKVLV